MDEEIALGLAQEAVEKERFRCLAVIDSVAKRTEKLKDDPLWKSGKWSRGKAYRWLQKQMNLTRDECHIGMFDKDQCAKLIELLGDAK